MPGQSGFSAPRRLATVLLLGLGFFSFSPNGHAFLFHSKRKAEEKAAIEQMKTFQPPAANSLTTQCDPYRQQVIKYRQKPWLVRPLYGPRSLYLVSKHRKCIDGLMDQEYLYLKHAQIQVTPKLPHMAMPIDPENPPTTETSPGGVITPVSTPTTNPASSTTPQSPTGKTQETQSK